MVTPEVVTYLSPLQMGVGIPNGTVAIVHAARLISDVDGTDKSKVLLKVDFKNAFNTVSREKMFEVVRRVCPKLSAWTEFCYASKPYLFIGKETIRSTQGVQQGDPLGPIFFSLVLHDLVLKIQSQVPTLDLQGWYIDDGTVIGDRADVRRALQIIQQEARELGLELNLYKCELWWPNLSDDLPEFPKELIRVHDDGVELLGCALGSVSFGNRFLRKKIDSVKQLIGAIADIEHPQYELPLLRFCAGMPKFNHVLRTTKTNKMPEVLEDIDKTINECLQRVLGTGGLDQNTRDIMGMPIRMGGLGIPQAKMIGKAAFVGCMADTQCWVKTMVDPLYSNILTEEIRCSLVEYNQDFALDVSAETLEAVPKQKQKYLTERAHRATLDRIKGNCDGYMKKVIQACSMPHSADWLLTLPSKSSTMAPGAYRLAIRHRFGMVILSQSARCDQCKGNVDPRALHTVTCPGLHQLRHNIIRDELLVELKKCHLLLGKETPNLINGSRSRPADILICNYKNCRDLCVDVSIINAYKGDYNSAAGHNIKMKEDEKIRKYGRQLSLNNIDFLPFVMESTGGFGDDALRLIKEIAHSVATTYGETANQVTNRILRRVQFIWQVNMGSALLSMVRQNAERDGGG